MKKIIKKAFLVSLSFASFAFSAQPKETLEELSTESISKMSSDKQGLIVRDILSHYSKFQKKALTSQLNLDFARKDTYLMDLSKKDWAYLKLNLLDTGLPAENQMRIFGTELSLKAQSNKWIKVDLKSVYQGKIWVDQKAIDFRFEKLASAENLDKNFQKIFDVAIQPKKNEEGLFVRIFKAVIPIQYAFAMSSVIAPVFRGVSSTVSGLFTGFNGPVGQTRRFLSSNWNPRVGGRNTVDGKIISYDDSTGTGVARGSGGYTFGFGTVSTPDGRKAFQVNGTGNGLSPHRN